MHQEFDLLVIGGGSGGIAAAVDATNLGAKCAIIEQAHLGGTCSNLGCIPKKMMWYAASINETINDANDFGFSIDKNSFNWNHFLEKRETHIKNIRRYFDDYLTKKKITLIQGSAKFIDKHQVIVHDHFFSAKKIIIATGAKPVTPNIIGAEFGITSDDFFLLENQPKKIAIIGSGYIALELSCILQAIGSEVALIIHSDAILKNFDPMMSELIQKYLENNRLKIIKHTSVNKIEKTNQGYQLSSEDKTLDDIYDAVLFAIGRKPNTEELNLKTAGVEINENGSIKINKHFQTSTKNIYAVGDVTPYPQLAPIAIAQGKMVSAHIFSDKKLSYNFTYIPTALFTIPPAGMIGLTETEAVKKYGKSHVKTYQKTFTSLYDSLLHDRYPAAVKLICKGRNQKVIGCHIISRDAHEIIQGFALAMNKGITKKDLKSCLTIHPSIAEELLKI